MKHFGWAALLVSSTWGFMAPAQAANPDHVQRLLNTNQCPNCDLTGADLSDANLFGANLINSNLTGANLTGANLGSANLTDANLTDTILDNAYLYEAELIDTKLTGASLNGAYLRKAELPNVSLRRGQLAGANLAEANLAGADLREANLRNATLHHAKFTGIDLSAMGLDAVAMGSSFYFTTFFQATFCTTDNPPALEDDNEIPPGSLILTQLEGANLSGADLRGAFLVGANLQNANLRSADLQSACLTYAQLQGADLSNSQLEHTNFTRATIENARFSGAEDADLSLAYQTEAEAQQGREEVKLRSFYAEARNNVGALMRGQQAYYLENEEFTEDLQSLGLGIRFDQEHYDYGTTLIEYGVVIFAQAQQSNLKSVLAVVSVDTDEGMTFAELCWSSEPTQAIPAIAGLPEDLNDFVCPEGWEGRDY